jgi:prepilin-type N-terminal cleavage/methylation domain-containing protein
MHRKRGLTIIELVVVMCILGVMVLIAIPNIGRWLPRYRLRSAARDVSSNMQLARLGSIKDNRDDVEEKAVNLSDYTNVRFGDNGYGPVAGGGPVGDGVTFVAERAEFNPGGTSTAGTVYLQNNRTDAMAIRVDSSTGIIRVWTWNPPGWERM